MSFFIPTLYMLIGIPGSGKTTLRDRMNQDDIKKYYVSSDEVRFAFFGDENNQNNNNFVFDYINAFTKLHLSNGISVIYDATNISAKRRKETLELFKDIPNRSVAIFFNVPLETCIERNNNRTRVVPEEVIRRMFKNIEPPTKDEGFDECYDIIFTK